jgi:hypothetical protein
MVTDLHHFLDLPADTPIPARRLAEHLGNIVRALQGWCGGPFEQVPRRLHGVEDADRERAVDRVGLTGPVTVTPIATPEWRRSASSASSS